MAVPRYYLRCLCVRSKNSLKKVSKADFYLKEGTRKLKEDMDVIGLVRIVHNVDIMMSVLFS